MLMKFCFAELVLFEKHGTISNEQSAILIKMFLAMFFNTAIIAMVVRGDFSGFGLALGFWNGQYNDYSPEWCVT
jgi:hypothetical protein